MLWAVVTRRAYFFPGESGAKSTEVGKGGGSMKRVVEEEVSDEKTAKYLKKWERRELKRKEHEGGEDHGKDGNNEVRIAGQVVNEVVTEVSAEADQWLDVEESEDELYPKQVTIGRQEELEFVVGRLAMFEVGSYDEAIRRAGKETTTTKWVDGRRTTRANKL